MQKWVLQIIKIDEIFLRMYSSLFLTIPEIHRYISLVRDTHLNYLNLDLNGKRVECLSMRKAEQDSVSARTGCIKPEPVPCFAVFQEDDVLK
jgi:hypothetical protein